MTEQHYFRLSLAKAPLASVIIIKRKTVVFPFWEAKGKRVPIWNAFRQKPPGAPHLEKRTTVQSGYAFRQSDAFARQGKPKRRRKARGQERIWKERHFDKTQFFILGRGGERVAGAKQVPPTETERRIGSTIYIVTSHFQEQGSSAVDKIKRLIDMETKAVTVPRKV